MVASPDCRISLSAPSCLRGSSGYTKHIKLGSFCNGELMGKKLNLAQLRSSSTNSSQKRIQMSLNSVAGESKVQEIESEKRDPKTVASIILGGGAGTRLFPLTKRRAKPAVPIGGAYRLIDVPMSNCINSGINKVYILTQYNSASLNRHLTRAYNSNGVFGDGFVEALAATQTPGETGKRWFQGTADAVRQFHWLFEDARSKEIEDVLILSGDHLYRMDYMDFVQDQSTKRRDISISCIPIDDRECKRVQQIHSKIMVSYKSLSVLHGRRASDFGLMKIDDKGRVISFSEKPKGDDLKAMAVDTTVLGLSKEEAEKKPYIASMGVYVFKKEILLNLLRWRFPTANDFGSEIIPFSAKEFYVNAYLFNDYWEDIGTIRSFFDANLALTEHPPAFSFYDAAKPIYTSRRNLPPSKIDGSKLIDSIISHGSFLTNCLIEHSIVGIRSRVGSNVQLKDTVMLGADFYETEAEVAALLAEEKVPIGIGENTKISSKTKRSLSNGLPSKQKVLDSFFPSHFPYRECIIDKNARVGKNVVIANSEGVQEADRSSDGFYIRSGITVILKNSVIADGVVI
uniref:ADP-glucose pyrophosphorylase large subunit n=1 Tax=Brassica rapa subsp. pekinensis TaxID=51351 RepID=Q9AT45_BRARP|nr:ADP-glucose pyrophosphorylase large subunit [Brassica rapa subsp. pekinensis]